MKASIIVPVYNAAKYLPKTIESILAQTETDFEVIFIDDCSSDNTLQICQEIAKQDQRFGYKRNIQNSGPAKTRNIGIDVAKGDYLLFIDSDDTVHCDYVKRLTSEGCNKGADIVWCNFDYQYSDGREDDHTNHNLSGLVDSKNFLECYAENRIGAGCLWNKAYRRSFIEDNRLRLNENRVYGEDWDFNFRLAMCFPRVIAISDVLYHYIQYGSSVSRRYYTSDFDSYCTSHLMVTEAITKYALNASIEKLEARFVYNIISLLYKLMHSPLNADERKLEYERICSSDLFLSVLAKNTSKNPYLTSRQKITAALIKHKIHYLAKMALTL